MCGCILYFPPSLHYHTVWIHYHCHLQVVGQPSIFAIGDCAATTHGKTVLTVKFSHVGVIPNIHAAALNAASPASPVALKPIGAPGLTAMLVPIGSKHGAARIGPFHFGDRFARMKGADLFAPKFLAEHKYTLEELRPKVSRTTIIIHTTSHV